MFNERIESWLSRWGSGDAINSIDDGLVSLATDQGLRRKENQDRLAAMRVNSTSGKPFFVVALADGMGGMREGKACAEKAISAFFQGLVEHRNAEPLARIKDAVHHSNKAVHEFLKGAGGATLSAILLGSDHLPYIVNVGDSRIYGVEELNNTHVKRLTIDDSLAEIAGGAGKDLIQFIGMGNGIQPHIMTLENTVYEVILTTDGVHFIDETMLFNIIRNEREPEELANKLIKVANWSGSPDNATVSVLNVHKLMLNLTGYVDSGIELFDPFGALHIIWVKPEDTRVNSAIDLNCLPTVRAPTKGDLDNEDDPESVSLAQKSKRKGATPKARKNKAKIKQLEIEIVTIDDLQQAKDSK